MEIGARRLFEGLKDATRDRCIEEGIAGAAQIRRRVCN